NRMLLAEANQWPEDAAAYYAQGNECHMNFHFPLMPRLFMSLQMEDSFPIIDILQQTPQIPDNCQWALFLRNHDELTLEMVTDEDRDYMYRVYAQDPVMRLNLGIRRRLSPLMENNRRRIELMNGLLLSLPGTPVLYYGDEIGMGDNVYLGDRNGVRTPMQWSGDRNAGFSRTNPQRLYAPPIVDPEYHYEAVNVEAQRANTQSLWWWMKRLIATRQRFRAFGRGTFEFLVPENRKVLAFTRTYKDEHILVVANLSRFVQTVKLDLSHFHGMVPIEIFGRTKFPPIIDSSYFLSLGPHAFYWFTLQVQEEAFPHSRPQDQLPTLFINGNWQNIFAHDSRGMLASVLPDYLQTRRWFGGKARTIQSAQITEVIPVPYRDSEAYIVLLHLDYTEGLPETYVLPVAYVRIDGSPWEQESSDSLRDSFASRTEAHYEQAIAQLKVQGTDEVGLLVDALADKDFLAFPLEAIASARRYKGVTGELLATTTDVIKEFSIESLELEPRLLKGEQSNTSVVYGEQLILKLYRKIEEGINPDLEIGRFLTQKMRAVGGEDTETRRHGDTETSGATLAASPRHPLSASSPASSAHNFAPVVGALEYRNQGNQPITLGILHEFVPDTSDAWSYTLDSLRNYFEQVLVKQVDINEVSLPSDSLVANLSVEIPDLAHEIFGAYLASADLLGQRTAELHLALTSDLENPDFAPENFNSFYQRSIYQYMRNLAGRVLLLLKHRVLQLPPDTRQLAQDLLNRQDQLMGRFGSILNLKITGQRTRTHGDYHLGQVLYTGKDFIIIDFEGEPARPLSERRMKRSPLRDVAGMLQSFNYAVSLALRKEVENGMIRPESLPVMEQWAHFWYGWTATTFLDSYLQTAGEGAFLPKTPQELQVLLNSYLLEKAVYELGYELNNRPDWAEIPLQRILQLLEFSD
ncbi:MAG: alpha-glucosidase C-terminal domain-containing protein, partial [Coleofasciculus sp. S288]|nr:alpha-glucosidase C-terminal domain-containing protein [Coleofasciculus sp. S288]